MDYGGEITFAALLAIPIACVVWTFTQEELFKEVREALKAYQQAYPHSLWRRKLAYLPTCPYCLSHYVSALFVAAFRFPMLVNDWRGYVVSVFTLVLIANVYITLYNLLRVMLRAAKAMADRTEAGVLKPPARVETERAERPKKRPVSAGMRNGSSRYVNS